MLRKCAFALAIMLQSNFFLPGFAIAQSALDVTPGVVGMGETVTVRCRGLMAPALYDQLVVVRKGTPDFDSSGAVDEKQFYWRGLPNLYDCAGAGITLPIFMKGSYEVRYLSRQYNPGGAMQVVARAEFVYR